MTTTTKRIPLYLKEIYGDFYTNENLYAFFDKPWVNFILTCGFSTKLTKALLKELQPGQKVLQLGCTFGNQIFETATLLGKKGKLDLLDVSSLQIKRCKFKIGRSFPQVGYICQNANTAVKNNYDALFFKASPKASPKEEPEALAAEYSSKAFFSSSISNAFTDTPNLPFFLSTEVSLASKT